MNELEAIRERAEAAKADGEYAYGDEAQEHVAFLLAKLDEAVELLGETFDRAEAKQWHYELDGECATCPSDWPCWWEQARAFLAAFDTPTQGPETK